MSISARVIADSVSPTGVRLTSFVLHYPRFVHSEFLTHRLFSRNAASSRAIPLDKFISRVVEDPAMPVFWGANKPGMQAAVEIDDVYAAEAWWLETRDLVLRQIEKARPLGLHKQIINRVMEPWFNITVIVTATDFGNWYNLRNDREAQPEIKRLTETMLEAQNASTPRRLGYGEWHLPFVLEEEYSMYPVEALLKFSVARAARVSYLNHDGSTPDTEKDLKLFNQLLSAGHMSPFEHQAKPMRISRFRRWATGIMEKIPGLRTLANALLKDEWSGNFRGWSQLRKTLQNEHRDIYTGLVEPWRNNG